MAQLTPEQISKAKEVNVVNIFKKLKDGATLRPDEIRVLDTYQQDSGEGDGQRFVGSQVELADLLGVTRQTIARWRREDGNPGVRPDGRYEVDAWRAFIASKKVGQKTESEEDRGSEKYLRTKRAEKLDAEIAILRGEWMPIPEVEKMGGELGSAVRKVVCQLHMIAPHVVGMTIPEAEKYLKEKEDEILGQLHLIEPETIKRRAKTAIENKK